MGAFLGHSKAPPTQYGGVFVWAPFEFMLGPMDSPWGALGGLRDGPGRKRALLGRPKGALGRLWRASGVLLEVFRTCLGVFLSRSTGLMGCSRCFYGLLQQRSCADPARSGQTAPPSGPRPQQTINGFARKTKEQSKST